MASTTYARALTIGILLSCAAFGAYGTFGACDKNGLLESLTLSSGYGPQEKYFLGGPRPYKTTYTGIKALDDHLVALVGFFVIIIDGPSTWDVTLAYWCLMAEVCAAWVFIRIEGHRGANNRWGYIVNWTGTFGVIMQNITFAITTPIYFIIHLLTSPASSSSNPTPGDLLVNHRETEFLPHHTALSFIVPAVLMSLPSPSVLSPEAHYTWLSMWQIFPITHTLVHFLHRLGYRLLRTETAGHTPDSKDKDRVLLVRAQRFILSLCFIPRTLAMAVALTPASLAPEALKPVFEQVTLESLLAPSWPWNSPAAGDPTSPAGKPELGKMFLQWDVASGGLAILAWAIFVYLVAQPNKGLLRDVMPKVLTYGVVGGPVAVATLLVMERDATVMRRSDKGKKQ